jgi:hypothetical protein
MPAKSSSDIDHFLPYRIIGSHMLNQFFFRELSISALNSPSAPMESSLSSGSIRNLAITSS